VLPPILIAVAAATPVMGCEDRITGAMQMFPDGRTIGARFDIDRKTDTVFGPLAFTGLRQQTDKDWKWFVERDQWMKSVAIVRPSRRVTLEIPRSQRRWMRFAYHGAKHRVTLQSCARGEGESGPSGNSAWSGGFEIDYAEAPRQGRCARLSVRAGDRVIRKRLFPRAGSC
jgi:hypothetical protein